MAKTPRKSRKQKAERPPTRRITVTVTIEVDLAERKIPQMLQEFPGFIDELRAEDAERQILAVWAVMYDCQDPVAEYQYLQSQVTPEYDVREVHIADSQRLAGLGYQVQSPSDEADPHSLSCP